MARETREQREAREAQEKMQHFAVLQASWPKRLLDLACEYANLPGFSVRKDDDFYKFTPSEAVLGYDTVHTLPFDVTQHPDMWDAEYTMVEAENAVKIYYDTVAEEKRKREAKNAALAKLTLEERKLLGINDVY